MAVIRHKEDGKKADKFIKLSKQKKYLYSCALIIGGRINLIF